MAYPNQLTFHGREFTIQTTPTWQRISEILDKDDNRRIRVDISHLHSVAVTMRSWIDRYKDEISELQHRNRILGSIIERIENELSELETVDDVDDDHNDDRLNDKIAELKEWIRDEESEITEYTALIKEAEAEINRIAAELSEPEKPVLTIETHNAKPGIHAMVIGWDRKMTKPKQVALPMR